MATQVLADCLNQTQIQIRNLVVSASIRDSLISRGIREFKRTTYFKRITEFKRNHTIKRITQPNSKEFTLFKRTTLFKRDSKIQRQYRFKGLTEGVTKFKETTKPKGSRLLERHLIIQKLQIRRSHYYGRQTSAFCERKRRGRRTCTCCWQDRTVQDSRYVGFLLTNRILFIYRPITNRLYKLYMDALSQTMFVDNDIK